MCSAADYADLPRRTSPKAYWCGEEDSPHAKAAKGKEDELNFAWKSSPAGYSAAAMKKLSAQGAVKAMTLIEVLVILAIIGILLAMILPGIVHEPDRSPQMRCRSNLKQNAVGFFMFAGDHGDRFPWQTSTNNGGVEEFIADGSVFPSFQSLTGYAANPKLFICPNDKQRKSATSLITVGPTNVSYFLNADSTMTNRPTAAILSGDRNLAARGTRILPGAFLLTTNADLSWTPEIHKLGGNISFADGHVEFIKSARLGEIVRGQPVSINRLLIP
jgi:prepilin-type processing-associated H-X9-DG protein